MKLSLNTTHYWSSYTEEDHLTEEEYEKYCDTPESFDGEVSSYHQIMADTGRRKYLHFKRFKRKNEAEKFLSVIKLKQSKLGSDFDIDGNYWETAS